ncbi:hypothetical protein NE237_026560 [Protea cynaroides]|uniref:Uncharacterized protein n=1 Tax=Protea cynaroides TaxID=273540 RepID=A0A9Q0K0L8_9MAGN|nr:hypothetical protein NE237_026560 [Protea cynaroides]
MESLRYSQRREISWSHGKSGLTLRFLSLLWLPNFKFVQSGSLLMCMHRLKEERKFKNLSSSIVRILRESLISSTATKKKDNNKMDRKRRVRGCSGDSLCLSPKWVLFRCLFFLKRRSGEPSNSRTRVILLSGTGEVRSNECERTRENERKSVDGSLLLRSPKDGGKGDSSLSVVEKPMRIAETVDSSGRLKKELSFNVGLGVGLAFVIASSRSEFQKMMELRTQMEMLIKEIKDGMQRKNVSSVESDSNNNLSCSPRDFNEVGNTGYHLAIQNHLSSNHFPDAAITMDCSQLPKCDVQQTEGCSVGIDQLEAELEAEIKHLQSSLCSEDLPKNLQPQWEGVRICFEKADESQDADSTEHQGVCPLELERRLHQLLESRQQEQITELVFALDCAKHKLLEKEMEISWWKDTARLISHHVPPVVRTCR